MARRPMPRPSDAARRTFLAMVPSDPDVRTRPMFGQMVAFVNGNMFMGLFGDGLFVRLSEADRALVRRQGGADFTRKGYVTLPDGWVERPEHARGWIAAALEAGRALPARSR
jgi:TfoX/Sxy family transcriptional regulator of competence genes